MQKSLAPQWSTNNVGVDFLTGLAEELKTLLRDSIVLTDEPMKNHTSFKTGGKADILVDVGSAEDLAGALTLLRENAYPYYIMGNCSNVLVRDKGIHGAVLKLSHKFQDIEIVDNIVRVQAGALLSSVAARCLKEGLAGFEFASGIPGTFGGAVYMNAGAYGGEMKDVLLDADIMLPDFRIITLPLEELKLGYRSSIIAENNYIVLSGRMKLSKGSIADIKTRMEELAQKRRDKQPLTYSSAGSTFKRPEGYFAGKLIEDAGLRGKQIGGAQVSEKHCGFIINKDNATSSDILELIQYCQREVYEKFGVRLETEVKIIGEE